VRTTLIRAVPVVLGLAVGILSRVDERTRLEQFLSVTRGPFTDLQGGVAILLPFLTSTATAFLPS
jgi:hypothetical protein